MFAEDVFENLVVFSKAQWLKSEGDDFEDPDGEAETSAATALAPGPMPDTVHRKLHKKWSYSGGAAGEGGSGSAARSGIREAFDSVSTPAGGDSDSFPRPALIGAGD